jgi:protein-arginine kinase activator protein McsA
MTSERCAQCGRTFSSRRLNGLGRCARCEEREHRQMARLVREEDARLRFAQNYRDVRHRG